MSGIGSIRPLLILVLLLTCGFTGCRTSAFKNVLLEGTFESSSEKYGEWSLSPVSCVDGGERGFDGIAFGFADGPIRELRLDGAQEGNNIVELHMADETATVYRVFERECAEITGVVRSTNVILNGRRMARLTGHIEYDCPQRGIRGQARFDGCLPVTW